MNGRVLMALLRKDLRCLLPLVLLVTVLFAADVVLTRLGLLPLWESFRLPVLQLSFAVLVLALFQLDSPVSLVDDWLCRPVPPAALLATKLALLTGAVYLPRALATLSVDLATGASLAESLQDALLFQDVFLLFACPLLIFVAVVTRTLVQGIGVLLAILVAIFVIPTPIVRGPGPLEPGIGDALLRVGLGWLSLTPATWIPLGLLGVGCWLVYWRRRIIAARLLLGVTVAATLLLSVLPMWLAPWRSVLAVQTALAPLAAPPDADSIYLRNPLACLPATRVADLATDPAFAATRQAGVFAHWNEAHLDKAGPESIAFLTNIEVRRLPLEWRATLNYVEAGLFAGGRTAPDHELRPARYESDAAGGTLSHAWVLPEAGVRALRGQHDVELRLRYYLTLLAPREFHLPTDGRRRHFAGLGYCSARADASGGRIEVECFSAAGRAAQISAELAGIPATRVTGPIDLAPRWLRWLRAQRHKLTIGSPRLTTDGGVTVIAWTPAGYLDESLTLPGVLGGDARTCPLPGAERPAFANTVWRDAALHEVSSINVADGVQLEVLDFGGEGTPLLLLPGLGATAHSFDDLAPRLATAHRVVAMTRRGTGRSSRPDFGYETAQLARDVLQVMDALRLERVVLVGHSIAGEELHWLGAHHPRRFRGLVYLDAAYDRSGAAEADSRHARLRELAQRLPPEPPVPPRAFMSYDAFSQHLASRGHLAMPEGELMAFLNVDKPHLAGTPAIEARVQQAIVARLGAPDYRALRLPMLAMYALPARKPSPPWYGADPQLEAVADEIVALRGTLVRENIAALRRGAPHARVIELPGASHYLTLSNPDEVRAAIAEFVADLPRE